MQAVVIIGSGLAGYTVARELRKLSADQPLILITRDDGSSYSKPMLSNALSQQKNAQDLVIAPAANLADQLGAEIRTGTVIEQLNIQEKIVVTNKGEQIPYEKLVLAVGADPIRIPVAGTAADQIISVNDLDDYRDFRGRLLAGCHVTIMGAGLIGCEFANDLISSGFDVSVVDIAAGPLGKLLPGASGVLMRDRLAKLGIEWHFENSIQGVEYAREGFHITLANGEQFDTHVVLSAVGLRPRVALAAQSGLMVQRGIVVDKTLQCSVADVYALGDCAELEGLILPFVMPIMHGARALAKTLLGEYTPVVYPAMPVVVKTPACPCVVSPPNKNAKGEWRVEEDGDDGVKALYWSECDTLLGFALVGSSVAEKQALTKLLPPILT